MVPIAYNPRPFEVSSLQTMRTVTRPSPIHDASLRGASTTRIAVGVEPHQETPDGLSRQ